MKQYLEQLRKECSDRMVDRVIDPETDKPSKVGDALVEFCFLHRLVVVALLCSPSFHGQEFIEYWNVVIRRTVIKRRTKQKHHERELISTKLLFFSHVPSLLMID